MAIYAIYKYNFARGQENIMNHEVDPEASFNNAEKCFEALFPETGGSMNIPFTADSGETVVYNADIQIKWNDIIVLTLQNEKSKKIHTKDYSTKEEKDYPYGTIIIDNRKGVGQIAIERSSAFSSRPEKIFNIIEPYLRTHLLDEHRLNFILKQKFKSGEFWSIINERRTRFKDKVKNVKFEFLNPRVYSSCDASENLAALILATAVSSNANKASLTLDSSDSKDLEFSRDTENIANLVDLCANNSYSISVGFQHFGVYNYGAKARAMVIMERPEILETFIARQTTTDGEYGLILWLDSIRSQTADYYTEDE